MATRAGANAEVVDLTKEESTPAKEKKAAAMIDLSSESDAEEDLPVAQRLSKAPVKTTAAPPQTKRVVVLRVDGQRHEVPVSLDREVLPQLADLGLITDDMNNLVTYPPFPINGCPVYYCLDAKDPKAAGNPSLQGYNGCIVIARAGDWDYTLDQHRQLRDTSKTQTAVMVPVKGAAYEVEVPVGAPMQALCDLVPHAKDHTMDMHAVGDKAFYYWQPPAGDNGEENPAVGGVAGTVLITADSERDFTLSDFSMLNGA